MRRDEDGLAPGAKPAKSTRRFTPAWIGAPRSDGRTHEGFDVVAACGTPLVAVRGNRVWAGRRVGAVGDTGNARTIGCHLHCEIHVQGEPIDPAPALRRWDRYS